MTKWDEIKFFKPSEFKEPEKLRGNIIYILDEIRMQLGKSINITSSLRTVEHNKSIGGVENSSHCLALDGLYSGIDFVPIDGMNDHNKFIIMDSCFLNDVTRIGIYKGHFHIDIEDRIGRLPRNVLWISNNN